MIPLYASMAFPDPATGEYQGAGAFVPVTMRVNDEGLLVMLRAMGAPMSIGELLRDFTPANRGGLDQLIIFEYGKSLAQEELAGFNLVRAAQQDMLGIAGSDGVCTLEEAHIRPSTTRAGHYDLQAVIIGYTRNS
ncbi:hypothetical protein HYV82_01985 [Candidatus Woesearchaeota archaeon]|nr:hypothetical protein [Candidatus Woesearchaeota archaeon]